MKRFLTIILLYITGTSLLLAQQTGVVKGIVTDEKGHELTGASIVELSTKKGTIAGQTGSFQLSVPANKRVFLEISFIGYRKDTVDVVVKPGVSAEIRIQLFPSSEMLKEVVVESWTDRAEALQQINLKSLDHIPLPSGSFESILTTLGASGRNELSSQYSVRGGNYDENLIYVNDIEVYKPMLVKAGQQEGMSFINSSMVSSVQFAAGGFEAKYGDKMSSVLDIRYRKPSEFAAGASGGLLGASGHIEGSALKNRFTYIAGVRYKSNQYLLKSMQTKGEYNPHFFDIQTYLTYTVNPEFEISFLGNLARNVYQLVPRSRETSFGTYQQTLSFRIYYEGQEKDRFNTMLGALTLNYHPTNQLSLKLTGSGFNTSEAITYDILGQYQINLLDNTAGSKTSGDSILNLGYGGYLTHARNYLYANIYNISHKGLYTQGNNNLAWGISAQFESFDNDIREWEMIDSAGYSMPYLDDKIVLKNVTVADHYITGYRFSGYVQDVSRILSGASEIVVNAGIRFNYLSTNSQFTISPRFRVSYLPRSDSRFSLHAAVGWYHQPPFYKEMRDPDGDLNPSIKAQRSIHYVVGSTLNFKMWERPFRFTAEAYYKDLDHLIPYVVNDVDIQYLPQYKAKGYATGIEFKINGEFVEDAESWATLSFLNTRENRIGDAHGSYPRPTNQLVNFGLFFQDYFPSNPSLRVHLNLYYASRLPYFTENYDNPENYFHLKAYQRVDIGFSKSVITDKAGNRRIPHNFIKDIWFSAEIFNLFGYNNMASFQWVQTVNNQEGYPDNYAVPNYLTGRLLNLRVAVEF